MTFKAHKTFLAAIAVAAIGMAGMTAAPAHAGDGFFRLASPFKGQQRLVRGSKAPWYKYYGVGPNGANKIKLQRSNQRQLSRKLSANSGEYIARSRRHQAGEWQLLAAPGTLERQMLRDTYTRQGR